MSGRLRRVRYGRTPGIAPHAVFHTVRGMNFSHGIWAKGASHIPVPPPRFELGLAVPKTVVLPVTLRRITVQFASLAHSVSSALWNNVPVFQ